MTLSAVWLVSLFAVEDIVLLDLDVCVRKGIKGREIEWNERDLLRNKSLKRTTKTCSDTTPVP